MYVWAELYVPTSVLYVCFDFSATTATRHDCVMLFIFSMSRQGWIPVCLCRWPDHWHFSEERTGKQRETEAERGRWRERRAQRIPRSLLVMRGCRGAVAAPNYYQAAATAGSKGPAGPQHKPSVERNRERKKGEAIVGPLHPSHPLLPVAATLTG